MRNFVAAANWKMNKSPEEAAEFMRDFTADWQEREFKEVVIFPTAICWREITNGVRDLPIKWGLQNAYHKDSGAFTGEVSMKMAADLGAQVVLIGHSERRTLFSESDETIHLKIKSAIEHGLKPMLCLGESLEQRESGQTDEVIKGQLVAACRGIEFPLGLYVAYEPVWAIGTGKVATPEMAQAAHTVLRAELKSLGGDELAENTPILYGGSVKPENAAELSREIDIDGFLVGGASLMPESFSKIIDAG